MRQAGVSNHPNDSNSGGPWSVDGGLTPIKAIESPFNPH